MINGTLQSQFNDSKIMNMPLINVPVDVSSSEMVSIMADKLLAEFNRMAPYAGYTAVSELTSKDIERYLKTLLYLRVCTVMDKADKSVNAYRSIKRNIAIPVLFYQVMICIGRAYDSEYNLEFYPVYSITEDELLSVDEMASLSDLFRAFENSGMKVVYGLPNDPTGEIDFMAMSHVGDMIVSYKRSHPCYGFLASFIKQKELNEVTGLMSRVVYGYESDYKYQLSALLAAINS